MELFDTHCHLDDDAFQTDAAEVVAAAQAAGVRQMLTLGVTWESSLNCIRLAETLPGVYAAVAIHPNELMRDLETWQDDAVFFERFGQLADHPRVIAIGETGLDLHWDDTPLEIQQAFLVKHLELARRTGLPVSLHCREAEDALLETVRRDFEKNGPARGILHSFSGDEAFLRACLDLGFFISYSGCVTFTNKKLASLRATVPLVPDDRILVETDSPYLTPMPFRGKIPRNTPEMVVHTAAFVAELRGTTAEAFAAQSTANANRLFLKTTTSP